MTCTRLCCKTTSYMSHTDTCSVPLLTSLFSSQLLFDMDKEIFPMVVQAVVDEGEGELLCIYHTDGLT